MKKILSAITALSLFMSISTFARAEEFVEAEMNTKFGNVYISGKTHSDIAGEQIGILVTDAEQNIAHIAQVKTDVDGIYEYKFKTDKNLADGYTIKALCNSNDISQSIVSAVQNTKTFTLTTEFDAEKINERVEINIENKFADKAEAVILFAFYDGEGKLISCSSKDVSSEFELYDSIEIKLPDVPEGAKKLKVYTWSEISTVIPLASPIERASVPEFDKDKLFNFVPKTYEAEEKFAYEGVQAIYYDGAEYHGKPTKVFAYFSLPEGASETNKVPAVVFLHGGGGTAYPYWVKKWNEKGYAAIAMDLVGHTPDYKTHSASGPINTEYADYATEEFENQWMYQTVVNAIYANNLLRSMPEIDSSKIGLTGISWGGVSTSTTIGIDERFAFAVPIYGCGFLNRLEERWAKADNIKNIWDPALFFKETSVPVCWVNSDHDRHFSVEMATLSYQEVNKNGGNAILSIHPDLEHGHTEPLVIEDIYNFADSIVNGEPSYMKITNTDTVNRTVEILVPEGISIASADVYTTEDTNLNYKPAAGSPILATVWSNNGSAEITDNIIKYTIPEKTGLYYINITDNLGRTVSTGLINN